jgi:hypothetical protein
MQLRLKQAKVLERPFLREAWMQFFVKWKQLFGCKFKSLLVKQVLTLTFIVCFACLLPSLQVFPV